MLTPKENYLRALHGEKPEWVPSFEEEINFFPTAFIWGVNPETGTDFMNIKWVTDEYGSMPDPNWRAMEDISQWRDVVKFPDLSKFDWEKIADDFFNGPNFDPDKVIVAKANTAGVFLIPINMMGWVDGLCALYDDPEEYEAFISAICDFLCEEIEYFAKYIHPDTIFSGDDFSSANGPFVSQADFQRMYKPYLKKIVDKIHEVGAVAEFHNCGDCDYIIGEAMEMGYDVCQLPIPNEKLLADKAKYGKRLVINGGWERHGDANVPGADEETVRASVRKAIDDFGRDGGLIFWDGGIIGKNDDSKQKKEWLVDELHKYGRAIYDTAV